MYVLCLRVIRLINSGLILTSSSGRAELFLDHVVTSECIFQLKRCVHKSTHGNMLPFS